MAKKKITLEDDVLNMLEDLKQLAKDKGIKVTISEDSSKTIITLEKKDKSELRKDRKGRLLQNGESQRLDGRYVYQYTDDNGRRCSFYAKDLPELREKEKQLIIDKHDGIQSGKADKITVDMLFEEFIESKKKKKNKKENLKETTLTNYRYHYEKYAKDKIGGMKLANVKTSTIEGLYDDLLDNTLSFGTLQILDGILKQMFDKPVRDDIIRKNPTFGLMASMRNKHDTKSEKRFALTVEEQEAFVNFAKTDERFRLYMPLFSFMLGTGCRVGEATGLTWDDIDFKAGMVHINHTLSYRTLSDHKARFVINDPKTAAGNRDIPMLDGVRKALIKQKENQLMYGGCDMVIDGYSNFVFTSVNNTPIKKDNLDKAIISLLKRYTEYETKLAKEENRQPVLIRHFSAHNIRHTFATNYCQCETNVNTIQKIMGHSDIAITMNVYAECTKDAKKTSFDNMEGKFKIG